MNRILRIAAAAAALALAVPASAQQSTSATQGKVGIGVGMPTNLLSGFLNTIGGAVPEGPQIYVPINVSPNLRIEPQFGYLANTDDELDETDSAFTLGAGVLYVMPVAQQTNLYVGGRLTLTWTKDEDHAGAALEKTTQRNTAIAPVLGGEYVPSPRFSVGAEAQLVFVSLGDRKIETAGFPTVTFQGGSTRSTQALVFVRVYFM